MVVLPLPGCCFRRDNASRFSHAKFSRRCYDDQYAATESALNQRGWADLEEYSRGLAKHNNVLYIVASGEGVGGEGSMGMKETTPNGKVMVPAKCWKVILVVENGTGTADDIAKVGSTTRTIGIVMPNTQVVEHDWPKYRVSVKDDETLTGYSFFDKVPAAIIDPLKAKVDTTHIQPGKASVED